MREFISECSVCGKIMLFIKTGLGRTLSENYGRTRRIYQKWQLLKQEAGQIYENIKIEGLTCISVIGKEVKIKLGCLMAVNIIKYTAIIPTL